MARLPMHGCLLRSALQDLRSQDLNQEEEFGHSRPKVSQVCELTLDMAQDLEPMLGELGDGLSEYSFCNLYLFRQVHCYRLIKGIHNRYHFIAGTTYDGVRHLLPLFELSNCPVNYLNEALVGYDCFYPISRESLDKLDKGVFQHSNNRDDSDYLYPANNFIHYRGPLLRKRRNLMRQFQKAGRTEVAALGPNTEEHAKEVLEKWQLEKNKERSGTDYYACKEALTLYKALDMQGYVHYRDGQVAGFVVGKNIGENICAIQFAKGLKAYNGVYQAMFQDYAQRYEGRYHYYNFEQDLGNINLRKNKMSYQPERLHEKYRVYPRSISS